MRKNVLFAVAGISLILTGCKIHDHRYKMIPVDDPEIGSRPVTPAVPRRTPAPITPAAPIVLPEKTVARPVVVPQKYEPMTGAVSSGGVDSAADKKVVAKTKKAAPAAKAENGFHIVRSGEFPERIARKYGISTSALLKANDLTLETAKKLKVGRKLVIPEASARKSVEKKTVQSAEKGKHRIKPGETPDVIARRYKVKVKDLMIANNLDDASARRLQVGQELVIPEKGKAATTAPVVKNTEKTVAAVKKDVPKDIKKAAPPAPRNEPAVEDLSLMDQTVITVAEETTYARLAAEYGVTEAGLRGINGGASSDVIPKGTMVLVPQK